MKRIALTTALILSVAAPAFAASDNAQAAALHLAASDTGSGSKVFFGGSNGHSAQAAEIFAQIDAEDTGTRGLPVEAGDNMSLSSKGGVNARAAEIFAQIRASENGDDR